MGEKININFNTELFRKFLDNLFLLFSAILMIYRFFTTIMRPFEFPEKFLLRVTVLLAFVVITKVFFDESKNSFEKLFIIFTLFVLYISFRHSKFHIVIESALLITGMYGIYYQRLLKLYFTVNFFLLLITIVLSLTGIIPDLVYNMYGHMRHSFGVVYPTDFAAHVFYLVLVWGIIRGKRIKIVEFLLFGSSIIGLELFCHARCNEISIGIWTIFLIISKYSNFFVKLQKKKFVKLLIYLIPIIFVVAVFPLCKYYNPDNPTYAAINSLLSGRLHLGQRNLNEFGMTTFGQPLVLIGNGGSTVLPEYYTFIDISYLNIALKYGMVTLVTVMMLIEWTLIKSKRDTYLTFAILLVCLTALIEHHLFEYHYNVLILVPFALLIFQEGYEQKVEKPIK